ncbi:SH3 domain-containing protein [Constantimarinum furrinae]|uniref:SH3b domain-containing protein n=1 Tax=Constantimarinum furrinae TaxID=2562285 RepID=A0A7G8PTB3_9FLAO|nr:SH3 domain-containing protein [Constantimarinum furrinae]QNJ97579.1 hypothetical protein ALE3EI_1006 [Constantimarinum furrinae]
MKKVAFSILFIALTALMISCNNETKDTETDTTSNDLAVADIDASETSPEYLYVTAFSGLSLREFNNLNSEKLSVMPYGTKVRVLTPEKNTTMTVGGIKGGMDEVEFNHKKGFAFNGYLSRFFPPEPDINFTGYATQLKEQFPNVSFEETAGGTASKPSTTKTLMLPTTKWHEAYFVAQRLFDFPKELAFPDPKGSNQETVKDKKPKKDIWTSELRISRNDNSLEKIEYVYKAKNISRTVSIVKDGEAMKISETETIE